MLAIGVSMEVYVVPCVSCTDVHAERVGQAAHHRIFSKSYCGGRVLGSHGRGEIDARFSPLQRAALETRPTRCIGVAGDLTAHAIAGPATLQEASAKTHRIITPELACRQLPVNEPKNLCHDF